jgi:hypothetical protein
MTTTSIKERDIRVMFRTEANALMELKIMAARLGETQQAILNRYFRVGLEADKERLARG